MQDKDLRLPPRQAATVRRQVEDRLRAAISTGLFKPGQRLIERELCKLTGVGRTSIREALRQLEAEQLVLTIPHRGPVVRAISIDEARQLYEVRALLEGYSGRMFAEHGNEEEIGELKEALEGVTGAVKKNDRSVLIEAKSRFYAVLMKGSRNELLMQMLKQFNDRISLLRITSMSPAGRVQRSVEELEAIYGAIAARDPDAAERACKHHIQQAAETALTVLQTQEAKISTIAMREPAFLRTS